MKAEEYDLKRQKYNRLLLAELAYLIESYPSGRFFQIVGWFGYNLWNEEPWVTYEKYLKSDVYKQVHREKPNENQN